MARKRYSRTRTVYRKAKRGYSRRKGLLSGQIGNVLIGAVAGFASPMIPQFLGKWTNPVAFGLGGYLLKKPVLIGIAGYELGKSFSSGGATIGSGGFETGGA